MMGLAHQKIGGALGGVVQCIVIATFVFCPTPSLLQAQSCPPTDRILWVGDSWAEIQWDNLILTDVLNQFGFHDKREYDDDPTGGIDPNQTAISGMTALAAADPGQYNYPLRIANTLAAKPEIDIVLISLGGNDMIGGGWFAQGYPTYHNNVVANNTAIVANINTIAQAALAARPDVEVVIYGYDYVGLWEYVLRNIGNLADPIVATWVFTWGNPPAGDFYDDLLDLETRKKALADGDPRIYYINNLGTMQNIHGHDTANWGIGITPRPDGTNFPATPSASIVGQGRVGTDRFGEPVGVQIWRSNTDWIHLSDAAYKELLINATTQYFLGKFRGVPTGTFTSIGNDDGFVLSSGGVDSTQLRMGTQSSVSARSILSFDTSTIPTGATITRASLYYLRSAASGTNPFTSGAQGEPRIDVKNTFFGGTSLMEPADWSDAATATDVGCFAGTVPSNSYLIRVDLEATGLAAIAKGPGALTQLRAYFQNTSGTNNHVSFADGTAGNSIKPLLDVFYTTGTPTPSPTASPTPSPTLSPTASPNPSSSPTATATSTASASASPTASASPSSSPAPSATSTATSSATDSPTATATASASPTPTATPTTTPTNTITPMLPTATPSSTPTATASPSASPSSTPNASRDWTQYV